ncbi:MAG: amidase family protein [Gammaproteobacteria bacterium]|nr:amidase family protein [Gammaproteobacteria bacterium]
MPAGQPGGTDPRPAERVFRHGPASGCRRGHRGRRNRAGKTRRPAQGNRRCRTPASAIPAYYVVAPAEASSNLARFDGVRYGYRCNDPEDLLDLYCRSRSEGFGREVKRRIMIGTYALSSGYYDAYYLKAQQVRRLIRDDFQHAFEDVDAILGPTTQAPAFRLNEKTDDPVSMYLNDIYTVTAQPRRPTGPVTAGGFQQRRSANRHAADRQLLR